MAPPVFFFETNYEIVAKRACYWLWKRETKSLILAPLAIAYVWHLAFVVIVSSPQLLICAELWCVWQQYACWEEGWYIILDGAAPIHGISSGDFHCCLSENEHTRNNYQTHCFVLSSSLPPWNYCTLKEIVLIMCLYLEIFGIFMIAMDVLMQYL